MNTTAAHGHQDRSTDGRYRRPSHLAPPIGWPLWAALVLSTGCLAEVDPATESETHFLACDGDDDCSAEGEGHVCFDALCKTRQDLEAEAPSVETLCAAACKRAAACLGMTEAECTAGCADSVASAQGACADATDEALLCVATTAVDPKQCASAADVGPCPGEQQIMQEVCALDAMDNPGGAGTGTSGFGTGGTGGASDGVLVCEGGAVGPRSGGGCTVQLASCADGHRYDMLCEPIGDGQSVCECGRNGVFATSTTVPSDRCGEDFAVQTCGFPSWPQSAPSVFDDCPASGGGGGATDCEITIVCDAHEYAMSCTPTPGGDDYACVCLRDGIKTATFAAPLPICSLDLVRVSCPP